MIRLLVIPTKGGTLGEIRALCFPAPQQESFVDSSG
jgi:hypothetical protein